MSSPVDWKLILRYLSKSISSEDEEKINAWLRLDCENQKLLDLLKTFWDSPERKHTESDVKSAWGKLAKRAEISLLFKESPAKILPLQKPKVKKVLFNHRISIYNVARIAAMLIISFSIPYLYSVMKSSVQVIPKAEKSEVLVEYGKTAKLTLTDGTTITLDAGTSLFYPHEFTGDTREVYLNGEGFFEVTNDLQKPFIIHANDAVIKVIGTKFNVRAWRNTQRVQVAVAEGKVSLRSQIHDEEAAIVIAKGRMSMLLDKATITLPIEVDVKEHIAWLNRELVLLNTPLLEVLDQLERWYKLQFKLPSPIYNSVKISGTIKKKSINDILEAISLMINLDFKRVSNSVVFFEKVSKRDLF